MHAANPATNRVSIIGGGASGVLLAAHLLRDSRSQLLVTLVEQRPELGAGIAYSTNHPDHLLNVRAANMSAFPDDVEHFSRWLREHAQSTERDVTEPSCFAPRHLYRDYLASLLVPHFSEGRLRVVRAEAVAIEPHGDGVKVIFRDGGSHTADRAVLATGNEGPSLPAAPWRHDGWSSSGAPDIDPDVPVLIIGTGLTMADWVLTLLHAGHRGKITAVSRHGLMPLAHRAVPAAIIDAFDVPFGASLGETIAWLRHRVRRAEAQGGDWRGILDGIRPHTQRLWQEFSLKDRRRFLRHARAWWDQHRHRIAPDAETQLKVARARGQLRVVAAQVHELHERGAGVDVVIAHRGTRETEQLYAGAVLECRGRASDVTRTENAVLQSLLASGQARPDPLKLGLDVTQDCAIFGGDGRPSNRLFAVGPVTSGVFWEITAVPDIRVQIARLAARLKSANNEIAEAGKPDNYNSSPLLRVVR